MTPSPLRRVVVMLTLAAALSAAPQARAVSPAGWSAQTEAEFAEGTFDGTAVNSRGELRLARKLEVLMSGEQGPAVVSALAVVGRTAYVGSGTEGVVFRVTDRETRKFAQVPGTMVCAIVEAPGGLLVGTGGKGAGLYLLNKRGKVRKVWSAEGVNYVWAIVPDGKDAYVATGPAAVYRINPGGRAKRLYEAGDLADNVLCLTRSAVAADRLIAGTDKNGLVVEIDTRRGRGRVILDADEKEVAAVLSDEEGGVYVATADAAKASPDGATAPNAARNGKSASAPTPAPRRTAPAPPAETDSQDRPAPAPAGDDEAAQPAEEDNPADAGAAEQDNGKQAAEGDKKSDARGQGRRRARRPAERGTTRPATRPARAADKTAARARAAQAEPRNGPAPRQVAALAARRQAARARAAAADGQKGNAVYYIQPDGLVQVVFRRPVTLLAMTRQDDRLILGTGNGGTVYAVGLSGEPVIALADTEAKQVTALAGGAGGSLVLGTANRGGVAVLSKDRRRRGSYVSKVLDAKQVAQWGTVKLRVNAPAGTQVTLATRSGMVAEPDERTWSDWTGELPAGEEYLRIAAPAGRYLQYRLTLSAAKADGPTVEGVQVIYQLGNLPPQVLALQVQPAPAGANKAEGPLVMRVGQAKAQDVNGDTLSYSVQLRQVGHGRWIEIFEKLPEPKFSWDTRTVADGLYELRFVASDAPSNPAESALSAARISEPILVDNTRPEVQRFDARRDGRTVKVTARAVDAASRILAISYAVDSQTDWQAVLPADGIADSARERFSFTLTDLKPGPHRLAIRVVDAMGNVGYHAETVNVGR